MKTISINKIKEIRSLQQKKFRDELSLFVVEGEKMVLEVLNTIPEQVEYCIVAKDFDIKENYPTITFLEADNETLKRCSSLQSPNKIIAIIKKFKVERPKSTFILALDSIQDPGNMGTIMRLADWFGVQEIVCSTTTVDFYNSKVIQASMGAFLRVKISYTDLELYLKETSLPIYGALLEGENVYTQKLKSHGILLMGNEGKGISESVAKFISNPISIPRFGGAESLNVSVATGILLSEFMRGN